MQVETRIKAADGRSFGGFVAYPETSAACPAVIVIQEIYGVNHDMRAACTKLAASGFMAIAPDLFWRQEPGVSLRATISADVERAFKFLGGFDVDLGIEDLKATLDHVRSDSRCNGKVGTVGYCLGGLLSYLMACRSNADCNVGYYGVGIENHLESAAQIQRPLLLHIAGEDQFVPPAAQRMILDAFANSSIVEAIAYPNAGHAFARVGDPHFNRDAATVADSRTQAFLQDHLCE